MTELAAQPDVPVLDTDGDVKLHRCPECSYDLANLPRCHTCPECGFAYDDTMFDVFIGPGAFRHGSRWIAFVGTLLIALLICAGADVVIIILTSSIILGIWIICEIGLRRGISNGRYRLVVMSDETRLVAGGTINRSYRTREFGSVVARRNLLGGYRLKLCGARWADAGGPRDPFLACHIATDTKQANLIVRAIRRSVETARERVRAQTSRTPKAR